MGGVSAIAVDQISPNPRQPRIHFDAVELAELAASIREHGVIQPLIVTRGPEPGQYTLIAGERRLLAARQAGLEQIPAIVREASEQQRLELALIENVQRADLNPLEAADAYRQLSEDFGLSQEQIAERVGKSRAAVANTLRLLQLAPAARQALAQGQISEGHGRALLYLGDAQAQEAALEIVLEQDFSVRQAETLARAAARRGAGLLALPEAALKALADGRISAEVALALLDLPGLPAQEAALQIILARGLDAEQAAALVRKLSGEKSPPRPAPAPLPELVDLEQRLRFSLGFPVRLKHRKGQGGVITIQYYSDEDLENILSRILGDE